MFEWQGLECLGRWLASHDPCGRSSAERYLEASVDQADLASRLNTIRHGGHETGGERTWPGLVSDEMFQAPCLDGECEG